MLLRTCVRLGVLVMAVSMLGCGGDSGSEDGGPDDAGLGDAGATDAQVDPPDGGGEDAGEGDAGPSPVRDVEWGIEPEPMTIDGDIALDFFYPYELINDESPLEYELTLERCMQLADREESCETMRRDNLPGASGVRWGIDPGSYAVGENRYRFRLTLTHGASTTPVDEDEITLVLTVTSCETCVGS